MAIAGIELLERAQLRLSQFIFVRSLNLSQSLDPNSCEIALVLATSPQSDTVSTIVEIRLMGATQFSLKGVSGPLIQIGVLAIDDISARGWEGINYEVVDYEDDRFRCFCKSVQIVRVERHVS